MIDLHCTSLLVEHENQADWDVDVQTCLRPEVRKASGAMIVGLKKTIIRDCAGAMSMPQPRAFRQKQTNSVHDIFSVP